MKFIVVLKTETGRGERKGLRGVGREKEGGGGERERMYDINTPLLPVP